jgi:hypothetical protein
MVTEAKGRIYFRDERTYVYMPSDLTVDSAFPFEKKNQDVTITINPNRKDLVVKKLEKKGL